MFLSIDGMKMSERFEMARVLGRCDETYGSSYLLQNMSGYYVPRTLLKTLIELDIPHADLFFETPSSEALLTRDNMGWFDTRGLYRLVVDEQGETQTQEAVSKIREAINSQGWASDVVESFDAKDQLALFMEDSMSVRSLLKDMISTESLRVDHLGDVSSPEISSFLCWVMSEE